MPRPGWSGLSELVAGEARTPQQRVATARNAALNPIIISRKTKKYLSGMSAKLSLGPG